MSIFILSLTIVIYSIVQSLFGVGLLVFGTPTLLLLGYPFQTALLYLLPASICISLLQLFDGRQNLNKNSKKLPLFIIPPLIAGLFFIIYLDKSYNVRLPIALLLIFAAAIRLSTHLKKILHQLLLKNQPLFLSLIGLIHGMTNMGGSLLTVYCSSLFKTKYGARTHIALGYFFMGISQIIILFFLKHPRISPEFWLFPIIAITTYLLAGKLAFNSVSENFYQKLLTLSMGLFGFVLLI